jgi:hypothetical protein
MRAALALAVVAALALAALFWLGRREAPKESGPRAVAAPVEEPRLEAPAPAPQPPPAVATVRSSRTCGRDTACRANGNNTSRKASRFSAAASRRANRTRAAKPTVGFRVTRATRPPKPTSARGRVD